MPMRKLMRKKVSTPRLKKSTRLSGAIGPQAIFLVVIGVMAAVVMLIAGRQSSPPSDVSTVAHARAKNAGGETAPAGTALETTLAADTTSANMPAPGSTKASGQKSPVTITGCLEHARETFRLRDTSGVEAAKSRSWKSGFLKKSSASIEVVDAANRLQLPTHVGQRVSVTGMLVDREMQGRSLKRIAASCDGEPVQGTGLKTIALRQ
jgi:hypothetical protein